MSTPKPCRHRFWVPPALRSLRQTRKKENLRQTRSFPCRRQVWVAKALRTIRQTVGLTPCCLRPWPRARSLGEGYQIPRGWLYRYISCPNYFGEIVEWIGWAVATWSLAGASFAAFTIANLAPRAVANHRWYHDKFDDYPPERKALVPFVV